MTQSEEYPQAMDGVLSQRRDTQLNTLIAIKDQIIGHPLEKPLFLNQRFMRPLVDLILSGSTLPEIRIEATTVLGSLFHGKLVTSLPPQSLAHQV